MTRARDRAHLIRTEDDSLVSSEVGIMHPASMKLGFVLMLLLFAGLLGVMIWASVVLADERPYFAPDANTELVDGYVIYYDRAAEPYCGTPARVLTGVVSSGTCTTECNSDDQCKFFTFDQLNNRCYLYNNGVLPGQYALSAVPGPTQMNADVFVKAGSLASQLRGVLRDGSQTIF